MTRCAEFRVQFGGRQRIEIINSAGVTLADVVELLLQILRVALVLLVPQHCLLHRHARFRLDLDRRQTHRRVECGLLLKITYWPLTAELLKSACRICRTGCCAARFCSFLTFLEREIHHAVGAFRHAGVTFGLFAESGLVDVGRRDNAGA